MPSAHTSTEKTLTYVDFATVYGMRAAITEERPTTWALNSIGDLGSLVLLHENVRIPSPPTETRRPQSLKRLEAKLETAPALSEEDRNTAFATESSVIEDAAKIPLVRVELAQLERNPECVAWANWHIEHEWPSHIERLEGLIDPKHLQNVATVLSTPVAELSELNKQARSDRDGFSKNPSDFARRAYIADALVRAIYYDELARLAGAQVVHHSLRRRLLERLQQSGQPGKTAPELKLPIPSPVAYLLLIINAEARAQRTPEEKESAWLYHVTKCRDYLRVPPAPGDPYIPTDEVSQKEAVQIAAKIAQNNGISESYKAARRRLDDEMKLLGLTAALGTAAAIWLFVPFLLTLVGTLAAAAGALATVMGGVGAREGLIREELLHYRKLAQRGPGRVTSAIWTHQPSRADDTPH